MQQGQDVLRGAFQASCHHHRGQERATIVPQERIAAHYGKKNAESSSSDVLTTPAARRSAPDPPGTSGEPTPQCCRHQAATEGKPAYAAVVAGRTNPQQPSGQPKPIATGSDSSEPVASPKAANRRMSLDMDQESIWRMTLISVWRTFLM